MNDVFDTLLLARWQFGLTTLYHFLFVPLTIGMGLLVAILQTAWYRTNKLEYLRLTKLFGKIFLINFAMGVVTGIVQEFQFGMNWSNYSRFVGDIFGAPLAMEGLVAFFLEATFIGLWIFGWDRLSAGLHLVTIWLTSIATILSAYFILAANAWMQNPVGYRLNPVTQRAELTDIWAVLTNPVALWQFPHTLLASLMFAATVMIATAAWHLSRGQHKLEMRKALKFGLWANLIGFVGVFFSGDLLAKAMTVAQPMKMASAEAVYNTVSGADASFSIFTLGTPDGSTPLFQIRIPYVTAFLATGNFNGTVEGINNLQAHYTDVFCGAQSTMLTCPSDGSFTPIIWVTYWAFRWMMGLGALSALIAVVGLWVTRRGREVKPWVWRVAVWSAPLPLLASLVGWIFTEMGRQPWIVFGLMTTEQAVSPIPGLWVVLSLVLFTAVYGALAVVEFRLITKAAKAGPPELETEDDGSFSSSTLATVY